MHMPQGVHLEQSNALCDQKRGKHDQVLFVASMMVILNRIEGYGESRNIMKPGCLLVTSVSYPLALLLL